MALFALRPPDTHHAEAMEVCTAVFEAAEAAGEDPIELAAQAGRESGWRWNTPGACKGPLQVNPRYFCETVPCDFVAAGIAARKRFRSAIVRRNRPDTKMELLCVYLRGWAHPPGEACAYGHNILDWTRRARRAVGGVL